MDVKKDICAGTVSASKGSSTAHSRQTAGVGGYLLVARSTVKVP